MFFPNKTNINKCPDRNASALAAALAAAVLAAALAVKVVIMKL